MLFKNLLAFNSPAQLSNLITPWRHNMVAIHHSMNFPRTSTLFVQSSVVFALYTHSSTRINLRGKQTSRVYKMAAVGWAIVQVFARWLEKTAQRWLFISGMFVLFAVNFKAVRHFCRTRRKYAVFFSYFSFDSSLTHERAQRIVWGHCVFLIYCLIPLLTAMFNFLYF